MAISQSPRNRFGEARSALSAPSAEARHYRREADSYGQAYRLLRREGRRGNLNAALEAPNLLQRAAAQGHTPGGIRSSETFRADTENFEREMGTRTAAREGRINRLMGEEEGELASRSSPATNAAEAREEGPPSGPANPPVATPSPGRNRLYAAIDVLEGTNKLNSPTGTGGLDTYDRGLQAARGMGVTDEQVGRLTGTGDTKLRYRQLLDRALGEATSPDEVEALKKRGVESGITPEAFDRRSAFWSNRRRLS